MTDEFTTPILIFCDGACSGNPGPGGWGAIVCLEQNVIYELGGAESNTTNNQMELRASIEALKSIRNISGLVQLYTDSSYVIKGITQWIYGWIQKDWKTAEGNDVANRALWEELQQVCKHRKNENKISWNYVRGHAGIAGNERVDEIAVAYSQHKDLSLFKGYLKDYSFDILKLPKDTSLPTSSANKKSNKQAYSYLSLVAGKVQRHKTWPECEARVKGVSGAKFKKALSAQEENEILESWGVCKP